MTLKHLREYRTYGHIALSYGLSESNAYENIKEIENILIKSKTDYQWMPEKRYQALCMHLKSGVIFWWRRIFLNDILSINVLQNSIH